MEKFFFFHLKVTINPPPTPVPDISPCNLHNHGRNPLASFSFFSSLNVLKCDLENIIQQNTNTPKCFFVKATILLSFQIKPINSLMSELNTEENEALLKGGF